MEKHGYVPFNMANMEDRLIVLSSEEGLAAVLAGVTAVTEPAPAEIKHPPARVFF